MIIRHIPPGDGALSNTEPHDEFLELCALSTSGQLTREEQERLREHVAVCSSCREALEQYEALVGQALPAIGAKKEPEQVEPQPGWSIAKAEAALFERIAREEQASEEQGRDRPPQEPHSESPHRASQTFPFAGAATWRRILALYAAAILLSIALGICAYLVGMRRGVTTATKLTPVPRSNQEQLALEQQLSDAGHEREIARSQIAQRDREIRELRGELEQQAAEISRMKVGQDRLASASTAGDAVKAELAEARAEAQRRVATAEAAEQELQKKLEALSQQSAADTIQAQTSEARVQELTRRLREREVTIDQQEQLLAHDRDIRELMGARDLYITEVYDVARNGTQKPYGRLFYTKGKSLIFYAYDLDQEPGLKDARTFQAWGRRGPNRQQALNLGIFYVDNAGKKRWVLKFDDPRTLAQIDAVFVTVEPRGGSQRPSGKSLLFAYLRVDANHP